MASFEDFSAKISYVSHSVESDVDYSQWYKLEKEIKVNFPLDYKKFVQKYGTGCLFQLIWILNPFSTNPNFNLIEFLKKKKYAFSVFEEYTNTKYPYSLLENGKGILPFGFSDNGDTFYWDIKDNNSFPDTILIFDSRDAILIEKYLMSFSDFLYSILNKNIKSSIIMHEDVKDNSFAPLGFL